MKFLLLSLSFLISTECFSSAISTGYTVFGTMMISGSCNSGAQCTYKEAREIIKDSKAFAKTGKLSINLEERVNAVLAEQPELSIEEAIDALVDEANQILSKNK